MVLSANWRVPSGTSVVGSPDPDRLWEEHTRGTCGAGEGSVVEGMVQTTQAAPCRSQPTITRGWPWATGLSGASGTTVT